MKTLSRFDVAQLLSRNTLDTTPRRKAVGTGDIAQLKQWYAAMGREPGLFIPMRVVVFANHREHFHAQAARKARQRETVALAFRWRVDNATIERLRIVLTYYGPRELDGDNLQNAFKAVRDELAKIVGVNDRSKWYLWEYQQTKTKRGHYGIRVLCYATPKEGV